MITFSILNYDFLVAREVTNGIRATIDLLKLGTSFRFQCPVDSCWKPVVGDKLTLILLSKFLKGLFYWFSSFERANVNNLLMVGFWALKRPRYHNHCPFYCHSSVRQISTKSSAATRYTPDLNWPIEGKKPMKGRLLVNCLIPKRLVPKRLVSKSHRVWPEADFFFFQGFRANIFFCLVARIKNDSTFESSCPGHKLRKLESLVNFLVAIAFVARTFWSTAR